MISLLPVMKLKTLYKKVIFTTGEFVKPFLDQLCEIIPEDDFDVIRALLSWDFTDEMELEEDDLGKKNFIFR